jgi:hypothetical protein
MQDSSDFKISCQPAYGKFYSAEGISWPPLLPTFDVSTTKSLFFVALYIHREMDFYLLRTRRVSIHQEER